MWAIIKKEFKSTFLSPVGYIIVAMFLIVFSSLFYIFSFNNRSVDLGATYFGTAFYGLPIIIAVLTMNSFAGEKNKNTDQLLFMAPRSILSIIMGKFFAVISVVIVLLFSSLMYYFILLQCGVPNFKLVLVAMLGFLLLSMAYTSFGLLASSITENQIIAAIITLVFLMAPIFTSYGNGIFSYLSLINFYNNFSLGIISIKDIIVLISFTIMCIILMVIGYKRKRIK